MRKNITKDSRDTGSTKRKGWKKEKDGTSRQQSYAEPEYFDEEEEERTRRQKNKDLVRVSYFMVALFLSMAGYLIYFNIVLRDDINNNQYNKKNAVYQEHIIRGHIYS